MSHLNGSNSWLSQAAPLAQANSDDRLLAPATKRDLATGEVFTATRAKEFGLIDEIGFLEDAVDRAIELAHLDPENVRVVEYRRPVTLTSMLGLAQAKPPGISVEQILEWSAPRAFYLATTLPTWVRNTSAGYAEDPPIQ